jgi:pyruvate dehydrogenase E1 component
MLRGFGWNVIKVIWDANGITAAGDRDGLPGSGWARSDGQYQIRRRIGAYVREHFWGADPRLLDTVKNRRTISSRR